jgi:hypothetical protein
MLKFQLIYRCLKMFSIKLIEDLENCLILIHPKTDDLRPIIKQLHGIVESTY